MHVRDLVELGALVASHGTLLIHRSSLLTRRPMERYWIASRCRQDRWYRAIKSYRQSSGADAQARWSALRGVIEEILASELLTRTWSAVACAHDRARQQEELEPIARSVMRGHLEARNRALDVLVQGRGFDVEEGAKLNRLRRQTERWTDMMLGYLVSEHAVDEFAFSPQRARDFASDLRHERETVPGDQPWQLAISSLRATFHDGLAPKSPNSDLNERIAGSVLACFQGDLCDSGGVLKSYWLLRLTQVADDTQGLVDDLLNLEQASADRWPGFRA